MNAHAVAFEYTSIVRVIVSYKCKFDFSHVNVCVDAKPCSKKKKNVIWNSGKESFLKVTVSLLLFTAAGPTVWFTNIF